MGLETANYLNDLVTTNPTASDPKSQGDDHIRTNKSAAKNTFPGFTGAVIVGGVFSGTASAHVLTPVVALISYTAQTLFTYVPTLDGTGGAVTVNVSGLGAKPIKTILGTNPSAGDIVKDQPLLLSYDGTNMVLMGGSAYLARTGAQTVTGAWTITGNWAITGDLSVSGTLSGPSMTAKANKAGETFTGPHDFTAATMTVAAPSAGSNPVTKTYADGLAFATALPAQAGNAGKYVSTNGTTASWVSLATNGGATTTNPLSSDLTLTASSNRLQTVYPSASTFKAILPDATTMSANTGSPAFVINNEGNFSIRISSSDGFTQGFVGAGQIVAVHLKDASTAGGLWKASNWSYDISMLTSLWSGTASSYTASALTQFGGISPISATKFLVMASLNSVPELNVRIVDTIGTVPTANTSTQIFNSANIGSVAALSSTLGIATYVGTGGDGTAKALTLTSTTVTPGSPFVYDSGVTTLVSKVYPLTATTAVVLAKENGNNLKVKVLSISGTTVSGGSVANVQTGAATAYESIVVASSTKIIVFYQLASSTFMRYMVMNISGTTLTPGTDAALTSIASADITAAMLPGSTSSGLIFFTSSSALQALPFSLSGTVITAGTVQNIKASFTMTLPSVYALTPQVFAISHLGASSNITLTKCTMDRNQVVTYQESYTQNAVTGSLLASCQMTGGKILQAYQATLGNLQVGEVVY